MKRYRPVIFISFYMIILIIILRNLNVKLLMGHLKQVLKLEINLIFLR